MHSPFHHPTLSSSASTVPSANIIIFGTVDYHFIVVTDKWLPNNSRTKYTNPYPTDLLGSSYCHIVLSNQEHRKVLVKGILPSLDGLVPHH
jgi:hypothetical protein